VKIRDLISYYILYILLYTLTILKSRQLYYNFLFYIILDLTTKYIFFLSIMYNFVFFDKYYHKNINKKDKISFHLRKQRSIMSCSYSFINKDGLSCFMNSLNIMRVHVIHRKLRLNLRNMSCILK
jgi:hypothetical protein